MPETIAMTPPDRDGHQVYWEAHQTEHGRLYLPSGTSDEAVSLLIPENYREGVGCDSRCIGIGSIGKYLEAGFVHREGDLALKSAPFMGIERMLDWLRANLMFQHAILEQAEDGEDFINIDLDGRLYKLRTPKYLGALALDNESGSSLIAMSNELNKHCSAPSLEFFNKFDPKLLGISMRIMEQIYPDSNTKWDHARNNWILNKPEDELVRIDLFGSDNSLDIDDFRPQKVRFEIIS